MNRTLVSLSIASAFVLSGAAPASYADDEEECDGVLVQSRFALANCMIESAAAILAAKVTQGGCPAEGGVWDIQAVVPEYILETIPIQGWLEVSGNGDYIELGGESSARLQNSVNCRVTTTGDDNKLGGMKVTYSTGKNNFYVDAIVDKDESLLCITKAVSAGDIKFDPADDEADEEPFECEETNSLTFDEEDDAIEVDDGTMVITCGGEDPGPGPGPGGPGGEGPASDWEIEVEADIPELNTLEEDAFEFEIETAELGGCDIEVEAAIENLEFQTSDTTGGLTISGTLEVYVPEEEPEEDPEED